MFLPGDIGAQVPKHLRAVKVQTNHAEEMTLLIVEEGEGNRGHGTSWLVGAFPKYRDRKSRIDVPLEALS